MNRIDRLFGILLLLQTRQLVRAQDIASRYEISERTVYRDVSALMQLGIPIDSQAGEGYRLMPGYFLPPLVFTEDEAKAVFLGLKMLEQSGNLPQGAEHTVDKLRAALPERLQKQVKPKIDMIGFFMEKRRFDLNTPFVTDFQRAIFEKRVVEISYHSYSSRETTRRRIEPFHLTFGNGVWYISAFCRLRNDYRDFRLERIDKLFLLPEYFSNDHAMPETMQETYRVIVQFKRDILRWVHERQHYAFVSEEVHENDSVMTYEVHDFSELKSWILGWGASAIVLSPETFRNQIREELQQLLSLLT